MTNPKTNTPKGSLEYRYAERAPKLNEGKLSGRAAPFDTVAMIGKKPWGFREQIARGAFANSIGEGDVVLLDQHDTAKPISRQSAGTLDLEETKGGLDWDAQPSNTTYAQDAVETARAGNYGGCSFGFEVVRDSWHYNKDDDVDERTLHEVKLHEISLVTFPAYTEGTSVSARDQVNAAMEARDQFYAREYLDLYVVNGVDPDEDERGDGSKPYGDVSYADPGYQKDGKKRYPVDTKKHAKAALVYINKAANAAVYTAKQLASIKSKINTACKKFGVKVGGDQKNNSDLEIVVSEKKSAFDANLPQVTGIRNELVDILTDDALSAEARCLKALKALASAPADESDIEKHIRKAVKKALKNNRKNKVGTSAENDGDADDPICGACKGSGKGPDGIAECAGGCSGTGHYAGDGDDDNAGTGSPDHQGSDFGLGLKPGAKSGSDQGNTPAAGKSGAQTPGDPTSTQGSLKAGKAKKQGNMPAAGKSGAQAPGNPSQMNSNDDPDEETRSDESESDSARDTDEDGDATRYLKLRAIKAREAAERRTADDQRRGISGDDK